MKVAFRADASLTQGTGHVVRSLTLAREFQKSGHDVCLFGETSNITWLENLISLSGVAFVKCTKNGLDIERFSADHFDLLVVDSYEISAQLVSNASREMDVLAIVDGTARGIKAQFFLDHNLSAASFQSDPQCIQLIGPKFALVRDEIRAIRRLSGARVSRATNPSVLVVSGGTDPTRLAVRVSKLLTNVDTEYDITFIASETDAKEISKNVDTNKVKIHSQLSNIQDYFAKADVVISAAGTSVLDLSCIGIPTIYFSVADNQNANLATISNLDIGLTVAQSNDDQTELKRILQEFLIRCAFDNETRERLFQNAQNFVDGKGAQRVVEAIEENLT
jgi:UDP-2,4-diacetamido-2,4,6-trideoxy-beta-L-altropyranose hydrolase